MPPLVAIALKAAAPVVVSLVGSYVVGKTQGQKAAAQHIARAPMPHANGGRKKEMGIVAAVAAAAGTLAPVVLAQLSPESYAIVVQLCSAVLSNPPPPDAAAAEIPATLPLTRPD